MTGTTPVPDSPWTVDASWGQVMVLNDYRHRVWPESHTHYQVADVKHDPIYYFSLQNVLSMPQNDGGALGDTTSTAIEVPWFYLNTVALPVLMVLEAPLAQRSTDRSGVDPNYHGHLPETGETAPTPTTGVLKWEYPFLNPDGSVKEKDLNVGIPATRPAP
jgi:hypothetical protein